MDISQADQIVTAPSWRDDFERLGPDRLFVTAIDVLVGVTPEMIKWWFENMNRELYLAFHPVDHKDFAWVEGKRPGAYVGATHLTRQLYGGEGPLMQAHITFIPPEEIFDVEQFAAHDVGIVICAKVHFLDEHDRQLPSEAGRFAHVGVRRPYGTELRTAWWMNVGPDADLEWQTTRRFQHVHQEFACLASFLPGLYASLAGAAVSG
jgi:hypothetical protein